MSIDPGLITGEVGMNRVTGAGDYRMQNLGPVMRAFSMLDASANERLAGRAGLSPELLQRDGQVDAGRLFTLLDLIAIEVDQPTLGASLVEEGGLDGFGQLGALCRHSLTLFHVVTRLNAFAALHAPGTTRFEFRRVGDELWLDRVALGARPPSTIVNQAVLSLLTEVVRLVAGPTWCPDRVALDGERRPWLRRHPWFAGSRVEFTPGRAGIVVPHALQARPIDRPPYALLGQLISLLPPDLGVEPAGLDVLARSLATSPRSVQRKLSAHGLTYRNVLARHRFEQAVRLLRSGERVQDVSAALGYSWVGHFSRAFKSWTGLSPTVWLKS